MATVYLKDDNIRVKVPYGMNLRQVAMKTGASMVFGCRVGDCGTCLATVEQGIELLNELSSKESAMFVMLDQQPRDQRFMCQTVVEGQEGEIVISYNRL